MRVYAVVERYADEYCSDYDVIVDKRVYLNEEDAEDRLEELVKMNRWSEFKISEYEVKE